MVQIGRGKNKERRRRMRFKHVVERDFTKEDVERMMKKVYAAT